MSSSAEDCLVEISGESYLTLRDKFTVDWPKHIAAFTLLNTLSNRYAKNKASDKIVQVYSLNGRWQEDGTFIAMFDTEINFGSLEPSLSHLKTALKLLDYSRKMTLMLVPQFCSSMMNEMIKELKLKVVHDDEATLGVLSREEAKEFKIEIPENFQLRYSLSADNVPIIQKVWIHLPDFSINAIPHMIEQNISVGLFNSKDELVAWCLLFDCGSIGSLHVNEFNRRKGFGEIVTKAICKKIAEENNVDVLTDYIDGNYQSEGLMKKIGFKSVYKVRWIGVVKSSDF